MRSQRFLISTIILSLSISSVVSAENRSFDGFYTSILLGYSNGRVNDGDLKYTAHCPLYGCGIFDFDIPQYNVDAYDKNKNQFDGLAGNLKLGYNKRFDDHLLGIELGGALQDLKTNGEVAKFTDHPENNWQPLLTETKVQTYETLAIRIGHIFENNTLIYVYGGGAVGQVKRNIKSDRPENYTEYIRGGTSISQNKNSLGYLFGAGLEYKLTEHLAVRANYEYVDFGKVSFNADTQQNGDMNALFDLTFNQSNSIHFSNLSAGVSYAF